MSKEVVKELQKLGISAFDCERSANWTGDASLCRGDGRSCGARCERESLGLRGSTLLGWECGGEGECRCRKAGDCCRRFQWWPSLFCNPASNVGCADRCAVDSLDMGPKTKTLVAECRPNSRGDVKCYCEKEGDCMYVRGLLEENLAKREF